MLKLYALLFYFANIDVYEELDKVLENKKLQQEIVDMVEEQLKKGLNGDGVTMASLRPYSDYYQELKGSSVVDLRLTGRFYSTLKFFKNKKGFGVIADYDIYGYDFRDVYGDITGLKPSQNKLLKRITELLTEQIYDNIVRISTAENLQPNIKNQQIRIIR